MAAINVVAILSLVAMAAMFFVINKCRLVNGETKKDQATGYSIFLAVMTLAFIIRLIVAGLYKGHGTDMNCFLLWGDYVFKDGITKFYKADYFHDYPPGYMYILYVVGWLRHVFSISWDSGASYVLTKMPAILSDLGIGYLIYKIACKHFKTMGAAVLTAAYVFCPVVFLDSTVWGQTDGVFTFFVVFMCYLVSEKKLIPSYFVFAIAILIKPQSLIFTPVLIYAIVDQVFLPFFQKEMDQKTFWNLFWKNLGLGLLAIATIGILMVPFGFNEAFSQYKDTMGSYKFCSVNAYNFWTLCKLNWADQAGIKFGLSCKTWGTLAIVATVVISAVINFRCKKTKNKYYFVGAFIVTCVFLFSVRMHERYIFPAIPLLLLAYATRPKKDIYFLYGVFSFVSFYNVAHVLFFFDASNYDSGNKAMFMISAMAIVAFCYMVYVIICHFWRDDAEAPTKSVKKTINKESQDTMSKKKAGNRKNSTATAGKNSKIKASEILPKLTKADWIVMLIVTVVYAIVAFVNLGNLKAPQTSYSVAKQGAVTVDFGKSVSVAKMWDFLGYQNNQKYYVEYTDDVNGEWNTVCGQGSEWDAGSVFCWNSKDLNISARYIRISAAAETTDDCVEELVFADSQGKIITPVNTENYSTLFDEQDLFEGRATNSNGTYFDEIYHGRTAYEMVHKLYCYENTHPPLGKALIAIGVLIFGMVPFGWRFMGTLFGVLMLPVIYNFAKKFFKETWIATITTVLFAFDFMHFVQTRIATIDVFVTLFIMLSYYFMYCYSRISFYDTKLSKTFIPLGLCGVTMGLSWASKWTGIYSAAGLALIFFIQMYKRFREYLYAVDNPSGKTGTISHDYVAKNFKGLLIKTLLFCCVFFVAVPVAIYVLSYIPFNDGSDRGLIAKVINAQKTMYDYHSNLKATHPYSSHWYQWPTMYRPIWYYSSVVSNTVREGISAFGNPLVWWAGIPASLFMLYRMFAKKDTKAGFLVIAYLSQYAPWFLVSRCTFIYHYFPSVPFVTVMVAYTMYLIYEKNPKLKKWLYVYTAAAVVLFVMFYPVLSGTPVTITYVTRWLKWFPSWVLLQTW